MHILAYSIQLHSHDNYYLIRTQEAKFTKPAGITPIGNLKTVFQSALSSSPFTTYIVNIKTHLYKSEIGKENKKKKVLNNGLLPLISNETSTSSKKAYH